MELIDTVPAASYKIALNDKNYIINRLMIQFLLLSAFLSLTAVTFDS